MTVVMSGRAGPREAERADWRGRRLAERLDCFAFVIEDLEQIDQAHDLQRLQGELGGTDQLEAAATRLGSGEGADQQADAAGIDHGDLGDVDHQAVIAGLEQFLHGLPEAVHRLSDLEVPAQPDDLCLPLLANVDIQAFPPRTSVPTRLSHLLDRVDTAYGLCYSSRTS